MTDEELIAHLRAKLAQIGAITAEFRKNGGAHLNVIDQIHFIAWELDGRALRGEDAS